MKRNQEITRKLFIEELERPAEALCKGATTEALAEEILKGGSLPIVTTLAIGEECVKGK